MRRRPGYETHFIFPVSFSDGVTEIANKDIVIFPSTQFHSFRAALGQCIGIHPNQFATVFLTSKKWGRNDIIMPVNSKTDFSKICGKREVSFLVLLKQQIITTGTGMIRSQNQRYLDHRKDPAANFALMKKDDDAGRAWERRVLRDLQIDQKDRFLVRLGMGADLEEMGRDQRKVLICEECDRTRGTGLQQGGFHHCVNDVIICGFRSTAGAVCRPNAVQTCTVHSTEDYRLF